MQKKGISGTCRSVYIHLRKVNSIRRYLTKDARKLLMNSTVVDLTTAIAHMYLYMYVDLPHTSIHKLHTNTERVKLASNNEEMSIEANNI